MNLTILHIEELLLSIVKSELSYLRKRYVFASVSDIKKPLDGAPFFMDSLELVYTATSVANYFEIHRSGQEDLFLRYRCLGEWAKIIYEVGVLSIAFQTSGTTAKPKHISHSLDNLWREAFYLKRFFDGRKRVVSMLYTHHIYGFIFSLLLPEILNAEVLKKESLPSKQLEQLLTQGDLFVSTPYIYDKIIDYKFNSGVEVVSSGAPLPAFNAKKLLDCKIERVWEVYGSTETAGVGIRSSFDKPYTLFDYHLDKTNTLSLQDNLTWESPTQFYVKGRVDNVVQIGGVNVDIEALRLKIIKDSQMTKDIAIRFDDSNSRLKAALVLKDKNYTLDLFLAWQSSSLASPERLIDIKIVDEIPKNINGKVADW